MIEINVDRIPAERRNDPELRKLIEGRTKWLNQPPGKYGETYWLKFGDRQRWKICVHEAGHAVYCSRFGPVEFIGPHVVLVDGGFRFRNAAIDWTPSETNEIPDHDLAKVMLGGPVVCEKLTGEPDAGRQGDIENFRRYLGLPPTGQLEPFAKLIEETKCSIRQDLREPVFIAEIFQTALNFYDHYCAS